MTMLPLGQPPRRVGHTAVAAAAEPPLVAAGRCDLRT